MQQTPREERPGNPVPQAAQHHGDRQVDVGHHLGARSGQGKVKVVAQPIGETQVPPPPEIGQVGGQVRAVEINRQTDAQQHAHATGNVGVAGEIEVQLQRISVDRNQRFGAAIERGRIEYAIDQVLRQKIGQKDFLQQPQADQKERPAAFGPIERRPLGKLGHQIGHARDRPGQQGGKKGYRGQVFQRTAGAFRVSAVEIDGVSQRLKGIKREPQRKDPIPVRRAATEPAQHP